MRRPGESIYDRIGAYDVTTGDVYHERGINLRHAYLTEYSVDDPEYVFVLGNKVMVGTVNANRAYFEAAVNDLACAAAEFPGWAARLLTHSIRGLANFREMMDTLTGGRGAIKVYVEVAAE